MNTNETKKKDLTEGEKLDIIIEKLNQLLEIADEGPKAADDEGPKDPGPIPPNP